MVYVKHFDILGIDTVQIPCVELQGVPNAATVGAVGLLGMDMTSEGHEIYVCTAVNGAVYTWQPLKDGRDGVSVVKAEINANDELILTLSNGNTLNAGVAKGDKGADGKDGENGVSVSVSNAQLNDDGELVITLSNGNEINVGSVKGTPGQDGVSITKTEINASNELVITFSNDTQATLGVVVGNDGVSITDTELNENGELIVTFSNGEQKNVGGIRDMDAVRKLAVLNGVSLPKYELNEDGETCTLTDKGFFDGGSITIPTYSTFYVSNNGAIEKKYCNVTAIGDRGFIGSPLIEISLPETIKSIGNHAFNGCKSLKSVTFERGLLSGLTSIGEGAFTGSGLTSIEIPYLVTVIGYGAFAGCESLSSVTINGLATEIGQSVFESCTSLSSVTIGKGVTSIGQNAFARCTSLVSVRYNGTVSEWDAIHKHVGWNRDASISEVVCTDGTVTITTPINE